MSVSRRIFALLKLNFGVGIALFAKDKPNVVVFLVDDLRTELGCYGSEYVKSPNIDALAKDGVRFSKAYSQQALSGPSRMSILTGLNPESIGIYSIFTPLRSVHKDMLTMPQFFKQNGYTTVSIGKVYHHGTDDADSWSILVPRTRALYAKPENISIVEKEGKGPAVECADVADDVYEDGISALQAVETLKKIKDDNFVMFVGLTKPHLPFSAPKKYWDLYNREDFKVPAKVTPKNTTNYSHTQWHELRGYYGMQKEGLLSDDKTRELIHGYAATVSYMDAQMGKVMKALDDLNLRENTIVVLMSDHGWKLGEYGDWCKHTNFELDVNVPLIVSREKGYKKRKTNAVSEALVGNVDIFPTLLDVCGFEAPKMDGKSILALVDNPKKKWQKGAYSLYARGTKIMGLTCTDGKYRYTEWWDNTASKAVAVELYTIKQDYSKQAINLAKEPGYEKEIERMSKLLEVQYPKNVRSSYPQKDKVQK